MAHNNQAGHPFLYGLHRDEYQWDPASLSPNDLPSAHRSSRPAGDSSSWSYISDDRQSWQNIHRDPAAGTRIGTPSVNSDRPHRPHLFCPICQKCYQGHATLANHLRIHKHVLMCVQCTEDGYYMSDNPVNLWACGFCVTNQLYKSEDDLHKHISKKHGSGDVSPGWDISLVIRNHLGHQVLQGHFQEWLRTTYPHLSANPPTLTWRRSHSIHDILRYLQIYPHERLSYEDAKRIVYEICSLKSHAFDDRPIRDNVTPSNVSELTYGVGQSLPHPQAANPDEAEEELPTTEPSIALSQYCPHFPSHHPDYVQDLDLLPTADVSTQQYVSVMEEPTNGLLGWSHTNGYPTVTETDETAHSADPLYNTPRPPYSSWDQFP